jgi:signal transduction histidine kinase
MAMRLSDKAAKIIFTTTAVVLITIAILIFGQIKSLLLSQKQINITNLVKLKLEAITSSVKDAESAQRGFLLTGDSIFLKPYMLGYNNSKSLITQVRELTNDDDHQRYYVNKLENFIEVRFRSFNHVFSYYTDPESTAEIRKMQLLRRVSAMDSIQFYIQNINDREDAHLEKRIEVNKKYGFLTPFLGILLMITAIGILVFSYFNINEQLRKTGKLLGRLRKMNNNLKIKYRELEMTNKELDSFTYIASHDLKEPVRKIITFAEYVAESEEANLSEKGKNYFRKIIQSAGRMQDLLNDLILYSRLGSSDKSFEEVDLNKVIEEVESGRQEEIEETGTRIMKEALPVIKGIPFQVRQLFDNLISNSIKYRKENEHPCITIKGFLVNKNDIKEDFLKISNRYHRLQFIDNGIGFDQQYSDKVFQLFQRLHPTTPNGGTGIGLTICKKIVENHNGYIRATSRLHKGTTFDIYFPAQPTYQKL